MRHLSFLTPLFLALAACEGPPPEELSELAPNSLVIDTYDSGGTLVRDKFPESKQRNITWCLSPAFNNFGGSATFNKIKNALSAAMADWQKSADIKFVYKTASGSPATCSTLVNVVPDSMVGDGGAFAPFPSHTYRGLHVGCKTDSGCVFGKTQTYYTQLFKHEVGHVLGYRHEFLNKSPACAATEGDDPTWEALTSYDPESAVNYIASNGGSCVGTATTTYLTNKDRQGTAIVYGIPWESLGASIKGTPAATSWGPNRLDVFARGMNDGLYHTWYDGQWHPWEAIGGLITSSPAAVSWGEGRIDVVARGADNGLWHVWFDGGQWHEFEPLGGVIPASTPAITSWGPERLDVFVRGNDNQLFHKWYENGTWFDFEPLGGNLASGVAAASWGVNRIDVFARGADGNLKQRWFNGSWQPWASFSAPPGGFAMMDPAVSAPAANKLDVYVVGASIGKLYRMQFKSGWLPQGWVELGTRMATPPAVAHWNATRIDLFGRRFDSSVQHAWFDGTIWR